MKVDLIPFWFPLVNGDLRGFNFFYLHKKDVFGADFEVNNTRFYHWKVLWKICLTIPLFIYVYILCFQNYIMEHYCEMNKSGFKVPELHPLPKGVSPGKLWKIYVKIADTRWLVLWH